MGYKGVPILALHRPFNLTTGVVADYLHCILLGVFHITNASCFSPYKVRDFDLGQAVITNFNLQNERLKHSRRIFHLIENLVSNEESFSFASFLKPQLHHAICHCKGTCTQDSATITT